MNQQDGGVRQELQNEVPIAGRIQAVGGDFSETEFLCDGLSIHREIRPGDSSGAERKNIHAIERLLEPFRIAAEHLDDMRGSNDSTGSVVHDANACRPG